MSFYIDPTTDRFCTKDYAMKYGVETNIEVAPEELQDVMKNNIVFVDSIKADGTDRSFEATLDPSLVPEVSQYVPAYQGQMRVYDLSVSGWRTLTYDARP